MTKVKAIMKKMREEAQADFENGDGDRDARREAMMKRIEKSDAEIMKLLTKDQKPKYEELKTERKKEMEQRRRDRE
jgi:Spy/CpxP family protein refolding chaperone